MLQAHLAHVEGEECLSSLDQHPTAAQEEVQYSVALPEKLTEAGPWLVRR